MKPLKAWAVVSLFERFSQMSVFAVCEDAEFDAQRKLYDGALTPPISVQEVIVRTVEDSEARDKRIWDRAVLSCKSITRLFMVYCKNDGVKETIEMGNTETDFQKFLKEEEES